MSSIVKPCPVCGQTIEARAKKCVHCNEFFDTKEPLIWRVFGWTGFKGKTLWDWMSLLIIPLALAVGGIWLSQEQDRRQLDIETDRMQENSLQAYFDQMTDLLLNSSLRQSDSGDEVRSIARSRTLTVLRRLDPQRKATLLLFLLESELINKEGTVIYLDKANLNEAELYFADLSQTNLMGVSFYLAKLNGADMSGANMSQTSLSSAQLIGADLSRANLSQANLVETNLNHADLSGADLSGAELLQASLTNADLRGVELSGAYINNADLYQADLRGANLSLANLWMANLKQANLRGADLSDAFLFDVNLNGADLTRANLEGALYNENTIWPEGFDPDAAGAIK